MADFGFYYTLQSNASLKTYPLNEPTNFTVDLVQELKLDNDWVVGLSEIHFPLDFKGLESATDKSRIPGEFRVEVVEKTPAVESSDQRRKRALPPTSTAADLLRELQQKTKKLKEEYHQQQQSRPVIPSEAFDENLFICQTEKEDLKNRCRNETDLVVAQHARELDAQEQKIEELQMTILEQSAEVERSKRELDGHEQKIQAEREITREWRENFVSLAHMAYKDANQMNNASVPKYLYVYSTVAARQFLGDGYSSFLRIVRVPPIRMNGETAVQRYDRPQYVPVSQRSFKRIEVDIRDERGRSVSFASGTLIVTLHFKRVPGLERLRY